MSAPRTLPSIKNSTTTTSPAPGAPWALFLTEDAGRTWREVPGPPV